MAEYEPVIGLEIHVHLQTRTKMFCGCELSFGDEPNVHTCPVCLAHPGVLPVTNERAIRYALMIAAALGCKVAPRSIFHRKNYFYPDNPKAYQISQYDIPLATGGRLGDVRIHRVHLEEDAAKMIHVGESGRIHGSGASLVDFNRAGTPLVEIVTEPDLRSACEVRAWAQLLQTTVRQLGVSDVQMEEGSLRVDGNVSLRPAGSEELGIKTELKNMNSFKFLERGIEAEIERQRGLLEASEAVIQETLHFDPGSGSLTPLRSKEYEHDYRYFPEPDLVPLAPTEEMLREATEALPELPAERDERYRKELDLSPEVATLLAAEPKSADLFEQVAAQVARRDIPAQVVANWVTGEVAAALRRRDDGSDASNVAPDLLAQLIGMVNSKQLSHTVAKGILPAIIFEGRDPEQLVEEQGLGQIGGGEELEGVVEAAIEAEPEAAEQVREGNQKAIGRIVGAVMKETKGRADGGEVQRLIHDKLGV
ncbi:MAG: Asp-tRNA(Asn)/Glu-tRNA(Gln) amidotransferase subunit GatB [Actinomycetota bacterium]